MCIYCLNILFDWRQKYRLFFNPYVQNNQPGFATDRAVPLGFLTGHELDSDANCLAHGSSRWSDRLVQLTYIVPTAHVASFPLTFYQVLVIFLNCDDFCKLADRTRFVSPEVRHDASSKIPYDSSLEKNTVSI